MMRALYKMLMNVEDQIFLFCVFCPVYLQDQVSQAICGELGVESVSIWAIFSADTASLVYGDAEQMLETKGLKPSILTWFPSWHVDSTLWLCQN